MRASLLLLLLGCAPRGELVDMSLWSPAQDDPFEDGPATVHCPTSSWGVEVVGGPHLEVDTGLCNYLNLEQPLMEPLRKGDRVHLVAGHDVLTADTEAQGHMALVVDGEVWWELHEDIPSDEAEYDLLLDVDAPVAAGTTVLLHLHNHGANTWTLNTLALADD